MKAFRELNNGDDMVCVSHHNQEARGTQIEELEVGSDRGMGFLELKGDSKAFREMMVGIGSFLCVGGLNEGHFGEAECDSKLSTQENIKRHT